MDPIAFLIDEFPVLSETFVGNEIRALAALGHPVEVIALRRPQRSFQPIDQGLCDQAVYLDSVSTSDAVRELIRSGMGLSRALGFVFDQNMMPRRSLLINGAKIASVLRARGCSHVHAHFAWGASAHAIVAARLAGISVSFVGHGTDVFGTPTDLDAKLRHADFAVATCDDTREYFKGLEDKAVIATIPCGIDPTRFNPSRIEELMVGGRIISVSRLIERKGVQDVLQALSRLDPATRPGFDIVGDGPMRLELEELAASLGLKEEVRFLGNRPADWLAANLTSYIALVAPYFEGIDGGRDTGPLVAKEALAMKVPVISSTFMGLKEIVDPGCGILVPPKDIEALARAIAAAAAWSPEERQQKGQAGRAKVLSQFTLRREAELLVEAVEASRVAA